MEDLTPPETEAGEVRGSPRHVCRASPLVKLLVRPSFQQHRAVARNVSRRGLALFLARDVPVGARVALYTRGARHGDSRVLTGRVVYANCHGGSWLIGCELSHPLSDAELASLV